MIKETELIKLNGSETAFGGRIYNADYQIGFNESPSAIRISIVNENGKYNIDKNDLSVLGSPDVISFGDREVRGFPIEYSIDKSTGGKILTVEYQDPSIIYLDKKFVVLNGTHIDSKINSPSEALITVGQKYYSEEKDAGDGVYVQNLVTTPINSIDLGQSLYYVSELYSVMQEHNIPMDISVFNVLSNKDGYSTFLNNIVGNLRSVLLAWANIMAFAFYWGEDGKLHFVDLESDISVDLSKLDGIIPFSDEESYSMKDTVDRGYALYYGKSGSVQSANITPNSTTRTLERGIRNLDDSSLTGVNFGNALFMIKAALVGEDFFNLYSLYLAYTNSSAFSSALGFSGITQLSEKERNFVDPKEEYPDSEWGFIKYKISESTKYTYGFFIALAERILTYEDSWNENIFSKYNWSRPITYDIENETEFLDPLNASSSISDNVHRAFLAVEPSEAFDLSVLDDIPKDLSNAIEFESSWGNVIQFNGFTSEDRILAYRLGVDYQNVVSSVKYRYENKVYLRIKGYENAGSSIFVIPRLEKIYNQKPSYLSNVLSTDMQIDTTDDKSIALAGQSFNDLASVLNESYLREDKTFKKTFSISGITLPQKITPEDGLQSVNISSGGDKGVTSSYTIGNSFFKIPSKEIILQKLEREKFATTKRSGFSFVFNAGGFNT